MRIWYKDAIERKIKSEVKDTFNMKFKNTYPKEPGINTDIRSKNEGTSDLLSHTASSEIKRIYE